MKVVAKKKEGQQGDKPSFPAALKGAVSRVPETPLPSAPKPAEAAQEAPKRGPKPRVPEMCGGEAHDLLLKLHLSTTKPNLAAVEEMLKASEPVTKATLLLKRTGIKRTIETVILTANEVQLIKGTVESTPYFIPAMRSSSTPNGEARLRLLVEFLPERTACMMAALSAAKFLSDDFAKAIVTERGRDFLSQLYERLWENKSSFEEQRPWWDSDKKAFMGALDKFLGASPSESAADSFISALAGLRGRMEARKEGSS